VLEDGLQTAAGADRGSFLREPPLQVYKIPPIDYHISQHRLISPILEICG